MLPLAPGGGRFYWRGERVRLFGSIGVATSDYHECEIAYGEARSSVCEAAILS